MKPSGVPIIVLLLCTFAFRADAQTFSLAGHVLGESFTELLAKDGQPDKVNYCRTYLKKKHNPGDAKPCNDLIDAASGKDGEFGRGWLLGKPEPFNVVFHVNDGHLSAMESTFNLFEDAGVTYGQVRTDAVTKFGAPTTEGKTKWQNGYGASRDTSWSEWKTESLYLRIEETPKQWNDSPMVTVTAALMEDVKKQATRSNAEHHDIFGDVK